MASPKLVFIKQQGYNKMITITNVLFFVIINVILLLNQGKKALL